MPDRPTIQAAPRSVLGKQVKQLRRDGRLPGNVYGRGIESVAIEIDHRDFTRSLKSNGVRGMFELSIAGEAAPRHVVLRGLARAGGTGDPIHVDFYQVDLNRPITAHVPVHIVGESPAVRDLAGTLVQSLDQVAIRCLPLAIPDSLEVDAAALKNFETVLTVGDLPIRAGVEVTTDPSIVVATVNPPRIRVEGGEGGEESES